jgi:hypothetical protein
VTATGSAYGAGAPSYPSVALQRAALEGRLEAAAEDVTGYRRVIHPELSKSGTCGLCVAAADRIYHVDDLMPIHTNCQCAPMMIVRGKGDPARIFNGADTTELYRRVLAAAGSTAADKLKNTRIRVSDGAAGRVLEAPVPQA